MGVTLGSGTTVNLENIPLRQFHNLSIHPATPVVIVVSYIAIVQWLNGSRSKSLSRVEAKRQCLELVDEKALKYKQSGPWMTAFVVLHNVLLAGFSYWCATNYTSFFAKVVDQESLKEAYCDSNLTIWNNMYKFNYLFYLSKYYELIDTFIILAKGRKATLLQTYHHAGAITTMWLGCYFGSPQLIFFVIENSIIHTLMYTYFALTAMGFSPPGKKYLTHLQIGQFLLGLVFIALYITLPNCLTPLQKNLIYVMLSYLIPLLYLFVDFSIKTYGRKKKTKTL
ncbi:hypothetical protein EC988_004003 [Linderina pennispora]|nr:hypothetical protein EC988_004003 [Linderina pennispora]